MIQAPVAFFFRAWRSLAQPINGQWINPAINKPRFVAFTRTLTDSELPRFFVIVMPFTLHFLLPCLALLQRHVQVVLLINGARHWERRILRERFPALPIFRLYSLPLTSIAHGDVINLLLENHQGNFGLIDHDCYIFDEGLFTQLKPENDEALLALFHEASRTVDMIFPHTYFLFFHAEPLRQLMRRYGVDARLYRETPPAACDAFARLGIGPGKFLKHYHTFHDTLHVLLGVALAEGMTVRYLSSDDEVPAMHVGGTSIGTHHTKGLYELYIHLRFLELLNDPLLNRRYRFLTAPLRSSADAWARRNPSDPAWQMHTVVENLIRRLHDTLPDPGCRASHSASARQIDEIEENTD